jgi:large subunit ribosomal protein L35
MPKTKPNKALLKRIRFTKSGKVKFRRAFGRHRRSHKSSKLKRDYRQPVYAKSSDMKRIRAMLFTRVVAGDRKTQEETQAAPSAEG